MLPVVIYITNGTITNREAPLKDSNMGPLVLAPFTFLIKLDSWFGTKDYIFVEVQPCYHNAVLLVI